MRYDPSVVDSLAIVVAVLMAWYIASTVLWVSVLVFDCVVCVLARIPLGAEAQLHAGCIWVVDAAWAMDHACCDGVVQILVFRVGEFCADKPVVVVDGLMLW
jgi:hypothetical protein